MNDPSIPQIVVFSLQFFFLIIIMIKVFFFTDESKTLKKVSALSVRFDVFNLKFTEFRKRETKAIVIAEMNSEHLEKIEGLLTKKTVETLDFDYEPDLQETEIWNPR